jgi:hypothetical protein
MSVLRCRIHDWQIKAKERFFTCNPTCQIHICFCPSLTVNSNTTHKSHSYILTITQESTNNGVSWQLQSETNVRIAMCINRARRFDGIMLKGKTTLFGNVFSCT